ncbi:MAG: ABC transporter ATP-binding protein [Lachnospiraceae bacterium]|nr:ABC transporter ATP-binding protein [Lachnospiraceae bacterium]
MSEQTIAPVLSLEQAGCYYDISHPVLSGLTFAIRKGEAVGLIGANGSGKSTLLDSLCGLTPHTGSMSLHGLSVEKQNLAQIRRRTGYLLQDSDSQLFLPTVYDDIAFAPRNYGLGEETAEAAVDEALERTGIAHLKHRQNYRLSGGEKRMVCLAVVLAMKPELVLMDEPSIALDPYNRRTLIRLLNQMPETKHIASHDLDLVDETCERVILLDDHGIRADGPAAQILQDEALLTSCRLELPLSMQKAIPYREQVPGRHLT